MTSYNRNLDAIITPSRHMGSVALTTSAVAFDWPTGTTGSTGSRFVSFNANVAIGLNMYSTYAALPTTNSAGTTLSSGFNIIQPSGHQHVYRIPMVSTGYSLIGSAAGYASIEYWTEI